MTFYLLHVIINLIFLSDTSIKERISVTLYILGGMYGRSVYIKNVLNKKALFYEGLKIINKFFVIITDM